MHAVGLYGKHGAGVGERDGCLHKMDMISGTLGKAVGCIGGYIVGSASLIDMLRSYGSGFIFTTALPPAQIGAALESLKILKSQEGELLRAQHQSKSKKLRNMLVKQGSLFLLGLFSLVKKFRDHPQIMTAKLVTLVLDNLMVFRTQENLESLEMS